MRKNSPPSNEEKQDKDKYREPHPHSANFSLSALDQLNKAVPINFTNTKKSCIVQFERFIQSIGSIDKATGEISLSPHTVSEKNHPAMVQQVKKANELITAVDQCDSLDKLENILNKAADTLEKPEKELLALIGKCFFVIQPLKASLANDSITQGKIQSRAQ